MEQLNEILSAELQKKQNYEDYIKALDMFWGLAMNRIPTDEEIQQTVIKGNAAARMVALDNEAPGPEITLTVKETMRMRENPSLSEAFGIYKNWLEVQGGKIKMSNSEVVEQKGKEAKKKLFGDENSVVIFETKPMLH